MFIRLLAIVVSMCSFQVFAAKKDCSQLLEKLQNIQSKQKQSQSIKSSISLREKEDKARDKWWECENNKVATSSKKKTQKSKSKKSKTDRKPLSTNAPPVFSSNSDIVIKGRFTGDMQVKWLEYYQRPKKCARPKTTQVFAFCMEDKTAQQNKFEKEYQKSK